MKSVAHTLTGNHYGYSDDTLLSGLGFACANPFKREFPAGVEFESLTIQIQEELGFNTSFVWELSIG